MEAIYFFIVVVAAVIGLSCIGSFAIFIYFIYKGISFKDDDNL